MGSMMGRPIGVTLLAVLAGIGGILGILSGLAFLGVDGLAASYGVAAAGGTSAIAGVVALVVSIVGLALAYGFWTLKPWAWRWGIVVIVVEGVAAVLGAAGIVFSTGVVNAVVGIAFLALIIWYLNRPEIRRAFGAPATGWPFIGGS